jgi:hypothetical protein
LIDSAITLGSQLNHVEPALAGTFAALGIAAVAAVIRLLVRAAPRPAPDGVLAMEVDAGRAGLERRR